MSQSTETTALRAQAAQIQPRRAGFYPALLQRLMRAMRRGRLTCITPEGTAYEHRAALPGPEAVLHLHHWRALRALVLGGDTGLAQSYIAGDWSSPSLATFLTWGAINQEAAEGRYSGGWAGAWATRLLRRAHHARNANTQSGSRRNIMAHYDVGNDFYAKFLDPQMIYSSALYATPEDTLEAAQNRKLDLVQDWLAATPGTRVLEIGCGWGALAARLASAGAHVTGLTLSPAQLAAAKSRLAAAGLEPNASLHLRDYRDETGTYDRIVSIEMLEAVGEAYWPVYFEKLRACLRQGGRAILQVISIDAARFAAYKRDPDFIQRYIFPGGMLPAKAMITAHAAAAGLTQGRTRHFAASYARTLAAWRARFTAALPEIEALGYKAEFRRLWEYYLCYCEAGFTTGITDVGLYEFHG